MPRLSKVGAAALAAFGWTSGGAAQVTANYLVVAGGGAGARTYGGGGGAGGYRTGTISISPTLSYVVTVGAGGAGISSGNLSGTKGSDSIFSTITSTGGGGGIANGANRTSQNDGGSGGGESFDEFNVNTPGQGNTPSTSPSQGNNGGQGEISGTVTAASGGGGGSGAVGGNGSSGVSGNGGAGTANSISGSSVTYAGGGGGGNNAGTAGTGGSGGGGNGGANGVNGGSGVANTGGGGGGTTNATSGAGGSGIVIISYAGAQQFGGGVVTSVGGNTIHTFTTSGTLSPLSSLTANFLVVAGGGGGGSDRGGGGGAGGYRTSAGTSGGGASAESTLTIDSNSTYLVTVGAGGIGAVYGSSRGTNGSDSGFFSITSTGGGTGGGQAGSNVNASTGGSGGGGGAGSGNAGNGAAGTANQGYAGANGSGGTNPNNAGGGGGGAGSVGSAASNANGGNGGSGVASTISGTSVTYAGGGGGSSFDGSTGTAGTGGTGGGGNGTTSGVASSGTANTGGGGGGGAGVGGSNGGAGGSGIVIISYPGSTPQMAGGTVTAAGGNIIHTFTSSGYLTPITNLNNSLRFRSSASAFLSRTPTTAGNRRTWTWSSWVKRGALGAGILFSNNNGAASNGHDEIYFDSNNNLVWTSTANNATLDYNLVTSQVFRDPSAWYHIVASLDTTQATASNRLRLFINGVQVTAFSTATYPSQNYEGMTNRATNTTIGVLNYTGPFGYFDGYLTDINFIDGQALTPSSFGAFNGQGVWQPVRYGGSYGTNGFYLPFTGTTTFTGTFNGTNQTLSVANNANLQTGTSDFTYEFWINGGSAGTLFRKGGYGAPTGSGLDGVELYADGAGQNLKVLVGCGTGGSTTPGAGYDVLEYTGTGAWSNGSWHHIAVVRSGNNFTLFLDGVSQGTFASSAWNMNNTESLILMGRASGQYQNGRMSNFRFIKGTALYTSNFVPVTSPLTAVSGTQFLTLQNATIIDNSANAFSITNNGSVTTSSSFPFVLSVGQDRGPAGNNWTSNNFGTQITSGIDSMTDVPTNTSATVANYCVLNPLTTQPNPSGVITNGNLLYTGGGVSSSNYGTFSVSSGKFYFETTMQGIPGSGTAFIAIGPYSNYSNASLRAYRYDTGEYFNGTAWSAYGATFTTNDVIGCAFDMTSQTIEFYKNGVSQGQKTSIGLTGLEISPFFFINQSPGAFAVNFGQRPFAYTPPAGFVALNTFNLPTPTIGATPATTANKYFDVSLYTGNGSTQSITNSGSMQPDFVWAKVRSTGYSHRLVDSVRGATKLLYSDLTNTEATDANSLTSFNSNGFSLGNAAGTNDTNQTFVAWQWRASNATAVTNTAGAITSSVSANTTAGFSIVSWTATGVVSTVGHGLGAKPLLIIHKCRNLVQEWPVITDIFTGSLQYMLLNTTDAIANTGWGSSPTSTVFSGYSYPNGTTMISYCFAPVAGYSAIGSYTGNGSNDGPFIYFGFRPAFIMIKRTDSATNWGIFDSKRSGYNSKNDILYPNLANAEDSGSSYPSDFVSNGYKIRDTSFNANGGTYIYMAFAESPFKYANAR